MSPAETAPVVRGDFPDLSVQSFAACEVANGFRLVGAPVSADTVYLVLAGRMHMRLPVGRVTADAGSLVLVPPEQQPGIAPQPDAAIDVVATRNCLLQRGGLLVFDAAHGAAGDLRVMVGRVVGLSRLLRRGEEKPARPITVDLRRSALARGAFAGLRAELDDPDPGAPEIATTLMKTCLVLALRLLHERRAASAGPEEAGDTRIAKVLAEIRARPAAPFTVEAMARLAGMSRATLARQFARHVGMTPMEFVLRTRLQDAAAMLRGGSAPIKQIAADAGFQSRSHFSRAFQDEFGVDPTRFRSEDAGDATLMLGDGRP